MSASDTFISDVDLHLFWGSERPCKLKCVNEVCLTELKINCFSKLFIYIKVNYMKGLVVR